MSRGDPLAGSIFAEEALPGGDGLHVAFWCQPRRSVCCRDSCNWTNWGGRRHSRLALPRTK